MGFLSALADAAIAVSDVVSGNDYSTLASAYGKIGPKKSYTNDDIKKMEDSRGRIAFTIRKDIKEDNIDISRLDKEARQMVMTILKNVEKEDGKFITPGYSVSEWVKKSATGSIPYNDIIERDDIIQMAKKW